MKILLCTIIMLSMISLSSRTSHAEGLSTLIEMGKSQKEMEKTANKETKRFQAVKKAVNNAKIKKGQSQDSIRKKFGEPVIIIAGKNSQEKWVYKPGYATFFDKNKIYLSFDADKKLSGIKVINK